MEPKVNLKPRFEGEDVKKTEAVLRKRNVNLSQARERVERQTASRKAFAEQKKSTVLVPHVLVRNWNRKHSDAKRLLKLHTQQQSKDIEGPTCLLAIRNLRQGASKATFTTLRSLHLTKCNTAVILPNNAESRRILQTVEPFVYFGYPELSTIQKLFERRAAMFINGVLTPVADNAIIEDNLGSLGLICVEDVVDAVWRNTTEGAQALKKFAPFSVADLKKAEGINARVVTQGNIKESINKKISNILA